jgi:sortase A
MRYNNRVHRLTNDFLTAIVILVAFSLIILPYTPKLLALRTRTSEAAPYSGMLRDKYATTEQAAIPPPRESRIVIPSARINETIETGANISAINRGGTLLKSDITPEKRSGNMVLVGHRFTYTNPRGAFYSLDKVKLNDLIAIYWNRVEYIYKVNEIKVVAPNDVYIEYQTNDSRLTLYTCTPLLTAKQRLVVIAQPLKVTSEKAL